MDEKRREQAEESMVISKSKNSRGQRGKALVPTIVLNSGVATTNDDILALFMTETILTVLHHQETPSTTGRDMAKRGR